MSKKFIHDRTTTKWTVRRYLSVTHAPSSTSGFLPHPSCRVLSHPETILGRALKSRAYFAAIEQNHNDDSDWITEWGANGPLAELTWILGERRVG